MAKVRTNLLSHPAFQRAAVLLGVWLLTVALGSLLLLLGSVRGAVIVSSAGSMFVLFFIGMGLLRVVLSPGHPIFGVARTLVDEAMHAKIGVAILATLALIIPAMMTVNPGDRLEYRMQFALAWGLTFISVLLSVMTIFLACGTVCDEIKHRQIFMSLTKPVSRAQYLIGKWLGIVLINLLLVAITGMSIHSLALYVSADDSTSEAERATVNTEVLVARNNALPDPPPQDTLQANIAARLEDLRRTDPVTYGENISSKDRDDIIKQVFEAYYSIPPRNSRTYHFTGLRNAREEGREFFFRFKPNATWTGPDEMVTLGVVINGRVRTDGRGNPLPYRVSNRKFHVIPIDTNVIDDNGRIALTLHNVNESTVRFAPDDGLEILYQVGGFKGNLTRAMMILWLRLCFIAALGLMAATFLSFPTACMFAILIYVAAASSGYIGESLQYFSGYGYHASESTYGKIVWVLSDIWEKITTLDIWGVIQHLVKLIGMAFMLLVPTFSDFNATPLVADGRNVPWTMVIGDWPAMFRYLARVDIFGAIESLWQGALVRIAVWTTMAGLIGILIFRRRELARVTV